MASVASSSYCDSDNKIEIHRLSSAEMQSLVESMEVKLQVVSSLQSNYDIYRVPRQIRNLNQEAYIPQTVSIGPLHYNQEHFHTMETCKLHYLKRLLERRPSRKTLEVYVTAVNNLEEKARKCYLEIFGLKKNDFVKMMVMDGCFILELLEIMMLAEKDTLLSNASWYWEILYDLIKLENQLPLLVLEHLYNLIFDHEALSFVSSVRYSKIFYHQIYVEFLQHFAYGLHGPSAESIKALPLLPESGSAKHILDLLRLVLIPSSPRKTITRGEKFFPLSCCASDLKSAGVKFRSKKASDSPKTYLFDIEFDMKNGILTIPTIMISHNTELVFRNLIAFEHGQDCIDYFTSYTSFMEDLIDNHGDAEFLGREGIIINNLGNTKDVVAFFNDVCKHIEVKVPYFSGITKDLEHYYNRTWNQWMANLKQKYFNTPWALISFAAAVLLFILTIIQTICSLLQFKQ